MFTGFLMLILLSKMEIVILDQLLISFDGTQVPKSQGFGVWYVLARELLMS
jgi:hypothetical protein